jgi:hypothetical protein
VGGTVSDITFRGPVLSYHIVWLIPYFGAAYTVHKEGWTLTPDLRVGPTAWGWDRDDHNYAGNPQATFLDNVTGGFYARLGTSVEFPQNGWSWGARASYEIEWGATGSTTSTYTQESDQGALAGYDITQSSAGAWFHELALTFFVRN